MTSVPATQPSNRKRNEALSKDGQGRSFPKVPCLLQYVSNGNYYGRIRVSGKLIRVSLNEIVPQARKEWLAELIKEIAGYYYYYKSSLATLKQVLK